MRAWAYFWSACFVMAGASFVFVAAVVLVRGLKDLRDMLRLLKRNLRTRDSTLNP